MNPEREKQDSERMIALFIDFENILEGAKEAKSKFEIKLIIQRLLDKGKILVRRAYADWGRFAEHKRKLHEAAVEMIDIPRRRTSGKNSADIRMVVDAIDLSYAKEHIDTFALITGDSDFSPLASKLKENDRRVLGCGVRKSTSDLLIGSCDEFIFYDDLVQTAQQRERKRLPAKAKAKTRARGKGKPAREEEDASAPQQEEALDRLVHIIASLEDDYDPLWSSLVKQTMRRVEPGFSEKRYGFRNFNDMMQAAAKAGHISLEHDESRGNYKVSLA